MVAAVAIIAVAAPIVPVVVMVPAVIMFEPAAISLPVALKELLPIVVRRYPARSFVGRPCPITLVPTVTATHWIPIALHPHELGTWASRQNADDTRRRGWTNSDSDGNLRASCGHADEQHGSEQCRPQIALHTV